jgi:hypothetical protein
VSRDRDALLHVLDPVRARLTEGQPEPVEVDPGSAFARVAAIFGLDRVEQDTLLLAIGCELDPGIAAAAARAQGEPPHRLPTVGFALATLAGAAWEAFAPNRRLRRYGLIELLPATSFVTSPYRVPERVLHAVLGVETMDEGLAAMAVPLDTDGLLTPGQERIVADLAAAWSSAAEAWPLLVLAGDDSAGKRTVAARVAAASGLRAWAVDAGQIPDGAAERDRLARSWEREAALGGAVLVLVFDDDIDPAKRRAALAWLERMRAAAVLCIRERVRVAGRALRTVDVERPTQRDQRELWRRALGGRGAALNGQIDHIVDQFSLDGGTIARIGLATCDLDALWDEVRSDARPTLDDLAQRSPGERRWTELVLPPAQTEALRQIVAHVRHRAQVYEGWGFGHGGRGLGVTALFSGPSGVGKTLAAEVIASELRLDFYRVDLSQVVSKYIGETEKNLRRVFAAADGGGAVLLFDEADALFGKRTEVSDSHDRYANIEVSYLLQRMESYRGLAILTTNFKGAIDNAFLRRLRFVVNFPFPDPPERARIWDAVLPPQLPRDGLDLTRLAQLNVAGGNIRNIALHAGFIAADAGRTVTMADMLRAARTEYAKLELTLSDAEIAGWR